MEPESGVDQRKWPFRKLPVANQCCSRLAASTGIGELEENGVTVNYQFGDVDARGALIRARAAPSEPVHRADVRDVQAAAGDP